MTGVKFCILPVNSTRPDIVEKDYVLGWLLAGISRHPSLGSAWLFKGGTCLKKCYLETYRFSEDLDFTVEDESQLDDQFLRQAFGEVAAVLPPDYRLVSHPYTDRPQDGSMAVRCYAFEEVFGEKIRALGERARPRDLYDVINLFRSDVFRAAWSTILDVVREKCDFKGIPVPSFAALQPFRDELTGDWQAMLGHQLPMLPPFEAFWSTLPEFFAWLEQGATPAVAARIPSEEGEEVIRAPVGDPVIAAGRASLLDIVRFAATNRLCVDLMYGGTLRRIEPYSLRRTPDGNLVLHAIRTDTGEHQSYRVDQIEESRATGQAFIPRYTIELTPTGPL